MAMSHRFQARGVFEGLKRIGDRCKKGPAGSIRERRERERGELSEIFDKSLGRLAQKTGVPAFTGEVARIKV